MLQAVRFYLSTTASGKNDPFPNMYKNCSAVAFLINSTSKIKQYLVVLIEIYNDHTKSWLCHIVTPIRSQTRHKLDTFRETHTWDWRKRQFIPKLMMMLKSFKVCSVGGTATHNVWLQFCTWILFSLTSYHTYVGFWLIGVCDYIPG